MIGPNVFISSCSRRQLARRRPTRFPLGQFGVALVMIVLVMAFAAFAFALGHGGI